MNRFFLFILAGCFLFSCNRKEENIPYDCGPAPVCAAVVCIAYWTNFSFSLIDQVTGKDLVFGSNPALTPADVKLFVKNNSPYREVKIWADSTSNVLRTMVGADTMAIQIKNEPLQYLLVKTFCGDCCSRTVVELLYEGQLLSANKNKVFIIKQ